MRGSLGALTLVTGITSCLALGAARAEERWYSVHRSDHRDWGIAFSGGVAFVDIEGDGTFDPSAVDTEFSFDGTLGLDEISTLWSEVDLQLVEGQHLRFAYTPMSLDGNEILGAPLVVDGDTWDPGDKVDSELRLYQYDLSFRSEFWLGEVASISPIVQISLVDAKVALENEDLGVSEKEEAILPLPYLGLRAEVYPLARLGIFAEGKGLMLGSTATVWDASGGVSLHLTRNVSLRGGYRLSHYDVDLDAEIDVDIGGPQVGATVRF